MSAAQHTPGPWHWDGNPCNYDKEQEAPWLVDASDSFPPILGGTITCQLDADARLIAAAPELLKTLSKTLKTIEEALAYGYLPAGTEQELETQAAEIRAAIAKATGEKA